MSDPLNWSPVSLGRWFGARVRVHITLIFFVTFLLLSTAVGLAAQGTLPDLSRTATWLVLLLLALAAHELGHAATAAALGVEQDEVHIWPLGSLVGPSFTMRSSENFLVAMAGPVVSGALFLTCAIALQVFVGAQFVWNPFGNEGDAGAPRLAGGTLAPPLTPVWVLGWFGYLNFVLMLANLIPALPFDGGRMFRAYFGGTAIASRDNPYALWTARASALLLIAIGVVRVAVSRRLDGATVIALGLLIEFLVRREARFFDDGGYFDDGVFGYDFSEGYTSLEASPAKVRPRQESVIKRWRRRRGEIRRERRLARQLAEERRMDEILEKLHREGKNGLTAEEHRFLLNCSARLRDRTKSSD